jgi:hypothetical protein
MTVILDVWVLRSVSMGSGKSFLSILYIHIYWLSQDMALLLKEDS